MLRRPWRNVIPALRNSSSALDHPLRPPTRKPAPACFRCGTSDQIFPQAWQHTSAAVAPSDPERAACPSRPLFSRPPSPGQHTVLNLPSVGCPRFVLGVARQRQIESSSRVKRPSGRSRASNLYHAAPPCTALLKPPHMHRRLKPRSALIRDRKSCRATLRESQDCSCAFCASKENV